MRSQTPLLTPNQTTRTHIIDVYPLDLPITSNGVVADAVGGDPVHASAVIADQDGLKVGTWTCEPGEFPWTWSYAETFYIIEGEGTVTDSHGHVHELAPGKVFFMPAGSSGRWKVTKTIRKTWVVPSGTSPDPQDA